MAAWIRLRSPRAPLPAHPEPVEGCSEKKHILHIITGLQRGGAETILVTLATELAKAPYQYQQSVIYFKDGVLRDSLEKLGIKCYKASYISVFWYIKKLKPDAIHSSLWSANIIARLYAKLFSIPVYCALHTVSEHSGNFRNYIDRLFPFKPTGYIAVSQEVKKSYTTFLPAQKITVIENGISTPANPSTRLRMSGAAPLVVSEVKTVRFAPSIAETKAPASIYTIGTIGRFVTVKNYHILLDACALIHKEFPHARLLLVGHGPLEQSLREQANRLDIAHLVTFVINKPAQEFYGQFDCFVQPSKHEGLSIALLEAMQAQLPVIVTGPQHQHVLIEHEKNGLVIEPNSVQELYRALKLYIINPKLAHKFAQTGKKYVQQHFSAATMAKKYHVLFNQ